MTGKIIFKTPDLKDEKIEKSFEEKATLDKNSYPKPKQKIDDKNKKSSKEEVDLFEKIWKELQLLGYGYEKGSDVLYLHFAEACEPFCDVNDIDIDDFSEKYEVNIG